MALRCIKLWVEHALPRAFLRRVLGADQRQACAGGQRSHAPAPPAAFKWANDVS
jgi:hypothetical protein